MEKPEEYFEVIFNFAADEQGRRAKSLLIVRLEELNHGYVESVINGIDVGLDQLNQIDVSNSLPLAVYFVSESDRDQLVKSCADQVGIVGTELNSITGESATSSWLPEFTQIETEKFCIVPEQQFVERNEGKIIVNIVDGKAFGTGQHATTEACVREIENWTADNGLFLDIGTGSGILAIVAHHLGFRELATTECDPEATREYKKNLLHNNLSDIPIVETMNLDHITSESVNTICANILAPVLHGLLPEMKRVLKPQGKILLSGFIEKEQGPLLQAAQNQGFQLKSENEVRGWKAIVLEFKSKKNSNQD